MSNLDVPKSITGDEFAYSRFYRGHGVRRYADKIKKAAPLTGNDLQQGHYTMREGGSTMSKKKTTGDSISRATQLIQQAVAAGLLAGEQKAERTAKDAYKATERRLYNYPILKEKLEADKERLQRMKTEGTPERSRGIARLSRPGYRAAPEEMLEALIADQEAAIAVDEYEVEMIDAALKPIREDPYFCVIDGKYLQGLTDDDIAESIPCEKTTVYRHRKRLVTRISVRLYGATALR